MFTLSVEDDQGRKTELQFNPPGLTIGRAKDNQLRLNERNVSRKHARINTQNGTVTIEDLDSYNGIRVNGDRISGKAALYLGDSIQLGDFRLQITGDALRPRPEEITQKTQIPQKRDEEVTNTEPMVVAPLNTGPQPQMQPPVQPPAPPAALSAQPPQPRTRNESFDESTALIRLSDIAPKSASPAQAIAGPHPKLVCISGPMAGKEWPVTKTEMVIGRGQENDIMVDHRSLSRQHAKIVLAGSTYRVIDCNSSNGTLVNGEKYAQVDLKRGDVIELGHVKVRLMFPGEAMPAIEQTKDDAFDVSTEISRPKAGAGAPTQIAAGPPPKSNNGILIAGGVGLLVAGIAIVLILNMRTEAPATPPVAKVDITHDTPPPATNPPATTPPPSNPPPVANTPPADTGTILRRANEEMAREQWAEAIRVLEVGLEQQPGQQSLKAALEKSESERKAKAASDNGFAADKRGDYAGAKEQFQQVPESSMYYPRAAKKLADPHYRNPNVVIAAKEKPSKPDRTEKPIAKAKDDPPAKVDPPPKNEGTPPKADPPADAAASPRDAAKKLFDQGNKALLQNKNKEAIELYLEATKTDPKYAPPHRSLGIAHARAGNGDAAVEHYKIYLKLSPGAPDAEQVRKIIHDYESAGGE